MSDQFVRDISRLAVGQICLTIGYNGTQVAPLDLLQDILHKFLQETCRDLRRQVEHYNRDEANLNDMYLTLRSLNISIPELLDYVNNVEPVPFVRDIPKFPAAKRCSLNFLKPGSKEVLTRPMHIYDHLPPIESDDSTVSAYDKKLVTNDFAPGKTATDSLDMDAVASSADAVASSFNVQEATGSLAPNMGSVEGQAEVPAQQLQKQARPDETSGLPANSGFIPPVLEGKLPDSIIPDIIDKWEGLDAPPSEDLKPDRTDTQELSSVGNPNDKMRKSGFLESANAKEARRTDKIVDKSVKTGNRDSLKRGSFGGMKKNLKLNAAGAPMSQGPKMVSKLLKKAKKNPTSAMFLGPSKSHPSDDATATDAKTFDLSNKARRKQQKLLRKYFPDIDPSFVDGIPPGPERQQLEKFLKKQNKQKQKRLKQQMALAQKNRSNAKAIGGDKKKLSAPELDKQGQMLGKSIDALATDKHFPSLANAGLANMAGSLKEELSAIPGRPEDYADLGASVNMAMQMKLSNEPDRSKLNILKKISKQMGSDAIPPNGALSSNINALIAGSENRVISLPSGTTITPTIEGASAYEETQPFDDQSANAGLMQPSPAIAGKLNIFEGTNIGSSLIDGDKPKKRGRKPGSKNNPNKSTVAYNNVPVKKSKKTKMDARSLQGLNVQPDGMFAPSAGLSAEPLNLSFANQVEDKNSAKSLVTNLPSVEDVCPQAKARKEKKKKERNIAVPPSGPIDLASDATFPTNEEVNSINRKLSRIDTVLKAAPSTHSANAFPGLGGELDFGVGAPTLYSPTKTSAKNKRIPNMATPNLTSFVPTTGFPIPMMPLYPFPRPGLIPTPTLFPNSVFNVNNPKKALPNMMLPNCMPFPNIKHPTSGGMSTDSTNDLSIQAGGVNCNVPRLVPEANKFLSPNSGEKLQPDALTLSKMPVPCHSNENDIFSNKDGLDFDASSNAAKQLLERGSEPLADASAFGNALPSKMIGANLMNVFSHGKAIDAMPTISLNPGDPIELSDDSMDGSQKVPSPNPSPGMKKSCSSLMSGTTLGMQVTSASHQSVSASLFPPSSKEAKKMKKLQKSNLKTTLPNAQLEVGKLAGGADLIPLSGTGVSYSAKTIPTTSLTASAPMQFPYMTKKEMTSCASEITITPSVVVDLERSSKDHKKLKKLKDGKIKKKKDKKDKLKSKERSVKEVEEATGKPIDLDKQHKKGLIKKLKKEKKKEKQRKAMESGQYFPAVQPNETGFSAESSGTLDLGGPTLGAAASSAVPKITLKLNTSSPSPVPPTPATDDALPQHVKSPVGSFPIEREKEPSPELAKISPLVTRPPKQKSPASVSNVPETGASVNDGFGESSCNPMMDSSFIPPPSPWALGGTLAANCVLLPQQLMQATKQHIDLPQPSATSTLPSSGSDSQPNPQVTSTKSPVPVHEISRPSSYVDAEGNRVWICPACGKVDDGSAMIGCDGCDAWYHWDCVGIVVAPKDNEDWFCRVCFTRKKGLGADKKKKRNKKK